MSEASPHPDRPHASAAVAEMGIILPTTERYHLPVVRRAYCQAWPAALAWPSVWADVDRTPRAVDWELIDTAFLPTNNDNIHADALIGTPAQSTGRFAVLRDAVHLCLLAEFHLPSVRADHWLPRGRDPHIAFWTFSPPGYRHEYTGYAIYTDGRWEAKWCRLSLRTGRKLTPRLKPPPPQIQSDLQGTRWRLAVRFDVSRLTAAPGSRWRLNVACLNGHSGEEIGWATSNTFGVVRAHMGELYFTARPSPHPHPAVERIELTAQPQDEDGQRLVEVAVRCRDAAGRPVRVSGLGVGSTNIMFEDGVAMWRSRLGVGEHPYTVHVGRTKVAQGALRIVDERAAQPTPHHASLSLDLIRQRFHELHEHDLQHAYRGDGRWGWGGRAGRNREADAGSQPLCRETSSRVTAYLMALKYLGHDSAYAQLARAGLDALLAQQFPEGAFPWWRRGDRPEPAGTDGAYETGQAGEAMAMGYDYFGDRRYLEASRRALAWYDDYRLDKNNNYPAFAVWHLAAAAQLQNDSDALEKALVLTSRCVLRGQTLDGGLPGHNDYTCYLEICLVALAKLAAALQEDHPLRPALRARAVRMTNQLLTRLGADGRFDQRGPIAYPARLASQRGALAAAAAAFRLPIEHAVAAAALVPIEPGSTEPTRNVTLRTLAETACFLSIHSTSLEAQEHRS